MKDVLSFVETISSMVLKFPKNIALKSQLNIYEMQFNWKNNYQATHNYSSSHS